MGDEISIKVKTLDGQSRDVKVSKNATVMDLKARRNAASAVGAASVMVSTPSPNGLDLSSGLVQWQ